MPWIGPRNPPLVLPWDEDVGSPKFNFLSKWPMPDSLRISGTMRWPSEPGFFPAPWWFFGILRYGASDPVIFPAATVYVENFWFKMQEVEPFVLQGETNISPYGSHVKAEWAYLDPIPETGYAGARCTTWMTPNGQPTLVRKTYFAEWNFRTSNFPGNPLTADPPWFSPYVGETYPWTDCTIWGMSECYPIETALPPDEPEEMMAELLKGVMVQPSSTGQDIAASQIVEFGQTIWESGGTWWSAGNPTKVVVPSGIQYVQLFGNVSASTSGQKLTLNAQKNDANFPGMPLIQVPEGNPGRRLNFATGPIPVSAGDDFRMNANTLDGTISNIDQTTFAVVAVRPPAETLEQTIVPWGDTTAGTNYVPANGYLIVPEAFDNMTLIGVTAAVGESVSSSGDITVQVNRLTSTNRISASMLSTPVRIDQGDWASPTSSTPAVIDAVVNQVFTGDILEFEVVDGATGAEGLLLSLSFESQN